MKKAQRTRPSILALTVLAALLSSSRFALAQQNVTDILIGKRVPFASKIFNGEIALSIYLPPGYDAGSAKYPVLYDLNAFATFAHDAGTVDYLSSPGLSYMPQMIVVGVPFLPADYVPTPFEQRDANPKASDLILKFFREELKPFIQGAYRTSGYDILSGHSVAGLFTTYALFTQPDLFSAGIASSPWFEAQDRYWLKNVDKMFQAGSLTGKSLFLAVGKREQELTVSTFTELEKWMTSKDLKGLAWKSAWFDGVDHMSMIGRSLYDGLLFIFDGWQFPFDLLKSADVPAIEAYVDRIKAKFGGLIDYQIPEDLLNAVVADLSGEKAYDPAAALLAFGAKIYPDAWRLHFRLADVFTAKGDKVSAAKSYDLSVQKNPGQTEPEKIFLQVARARLNPKPVAAKKLKMYPGDYGVRRVFLENGVLTYQRIGPNKLRLTPITETIFAVEGYDSFWLEFVITDGKVSAVVGLYADGRRESSPRTK
jgi:predicted alpha/beta superfamily hydrolase